jgi:predicted  nucleic acid-binding Zn-ribbon protein
LFSPSFLDGKVRVSEGGEGRDMAREKTIRGKTGKLESQLNKRVRALEREVKTLSAKLEKKEGEVKRIREKMMARKVKDIKKRVSETTKKIRRLVPKGR